MRTVRLTIIYSDYQYMVARQCFDYSHSIFSATDTLSSPACSVDNWSVVLYSKVPDVSSNVIIDVMAGARVPVKCTRRLYHLPTRDYGEFDLLVKSSLQAQFSCGALTSLITTPPCWRYILNVTKE